MRLADVIGQERAIGVLRGALKGDRVAHSYLFAGPAGVGKSVAALLFAQTLNCENPGENPPCGECRSCQLAASGNHPEVRLITFSLNERGKLRSQISIDQMRQDPGKPRVTPPPLIQDAYLKPIMGAYKVYIIDPADKMTVEAANALLKVLEEPPPLVVIILVTSEPSSLLPTVLSRCQKVTFQLAGATAIERKLMELGLAPVEAAALARLSGGRIAWAITAARRPEVLAARRELLDLCAGLDHRTMASVIRTAEEIKVIAAGLASREPTEDEEEAEGDDGGAAGKITDSKLRTELPWCLEVMASWYRDLMAVCQASNTLNPDYEGLMKERVNGNLCHQAECAVEAILETRHAIERNANVDLALESLAISLVGWCD